MNDLGKYGFTFRDDGSIEGYSKKIENLKKTLSEDEFDEVFDMIESYLEKTYETIPGLKVEWEEFNNEILKTKDDIEDVKDEASDLLKELEDLREDSAYKDHERDLSEVEGLIKINEAKLNVSEGEERIELLEKQIELTKRLQKETKDMLDFENSRRNSLMNYLSQYGFSFRDDGSMPGYGGIIENLKNTLPEDEFDEVFDRVEDYLKATYETIPDLKAEWIEINDEIVENINEIEELNRELELLYDTTMLKSLNNQFEDLGNQLDIINSKLKYSYGVEKNDLFIKSIELMNQQLAIQSDIIKHTQSQLKIYKKDLSNYGFEFDENDNITNLESQMNWFRDTDSWEKINDLVEDYFDAQGEVRDVIADYADLENAIKDAYTEQLEISQDIEEEITKMIEKEHDKRKDEIEKYTDERIKLLEKEKLFSVC